MRLASPAPVPEDWSTMERFRITKRIEFCYGHRLLEHAGKCRFLHGHNGVLEIDVEAEQLDALGMVVDFDVVKDVVKTWVDRHLDHKLLLCERDPLVPVLHEQGQPLFLMEDNPTAENIAKQVYGYARSAGLIVSEVRLWETASGCAAYRGPG